MVKERLIKYLDYKRISKSEFGRLIGVSNAYITSIRKSIQPDKLESIRAHFSDLNINWLLTGEGDMLTETHDPEPTARGPLVPILLVDGRGGLDDNNEFDLGHVERMIPWEGSRTGDVAIYVSGTSMVPVLQPGALALIRAVPMWHEYLEPNAIYLIELADGRRLIKVAMPSDLGPDYLTLHSYNPETPDTDIPMRVIRRVYRVVASLTNYGY